MRFIFSGVFFFTFLTYSFTQNLLPNEGFKQLNKCCEYHISCAPMGWWTCSKATFNFEPTRYDNQKKPIPVPALVMMQGYKTENQRSYIQAPLLCPLEAGKSYRISLLLKPRDYFFDSIGILVSDTFINIPSKTIVTVDSISGLFRQYQMDSLMPMAPTAQLSLKEKRRGKMVEVNFDYIAHGNEKFIVIGNFLGDNELVKKRRFLKPQHHAKLFYEIGSVTCIAGDGSEALCSVETSIQLLNTFNRRHSFYGGCHDTVPADMNRLFHHQIAWQRVYFNEDVKKLPPSSPSIPKLDVGYRIENLRFDFDLAVISESSYPSLDSLVEVLNTFPYVKIHIEGHTDSLGSDEYNQKLSLDRAKAVTIYLVKAGVDPERLGFSGLGSKKPVSSNETEQGRQNNRRVEYYLKLD